MWFIHLFVCSFISAYVELRGVFFVVENSPVQPLVADVGLWWRRPLVEVAEVAAGVAAAGGCSRGGQRQAVAGRGGSVGGGQSPSLLFFYYLCGRSICLASVDPYSKNTNKAIIALFPLDITRVL